MNEDEKPVAYPAGRGALLDAIVDHLPAMVAYWDRNLRNVFANATYTEVLGKTPEQIRGLNASELFGAEDAAFTSTYADAALLGHPQNFERTIVDHRGTSRCIRASYIPDVVDGTVVGIYALGTDITELMAAKRAERDSAAQIAASAERERIAEIVHAEVLQLLFAATLELDKQPTSCSDRAQVQIESAIEDLRRLLVVPAP